MQKVIALCALGVTLLAGAAFQGCNGPVGALGPTTSSKVMFVNASPNAPGLSILIDGAEVEKKLTFFSNTPYLTVRAGNRDLAARIFGTNLPFLIDTSFSALTNFSTTIFFAGRIDEISAVVLSEVLVPPPDSLTARIRFFQLSPGLPPVDLIESNGYSVFTGALDMQFLEYTDFSSIPPGNYAFELVDASSGETLAILPSIDIQGGRMYSLIARGLLDAGGNLRLAIDTLIQN